MLGNRYLQLFVSLFFWLIQELGYGLRCLFGKSAGRLKVLCYHEVTAKQVPQFRRQMYWLKKLTTPVFADVPLPLRSGFLSAVTFDDGFQTLLTHALPLLEQEKIPVTLFIPSACLGQLPVWLKNTAHPTAQEWIMTPAQLQDLSKTGVRIGSHSATHADLRVVPLEILRQELDESKQTLQKLMGYEINLLAFPFGRFNQAVLENAHAIGYTRVFAADPLLDANDFLFERLDVYPEMSVLEFILKIRGGYDWLPRANHWVESAKQFFKS